MTGCHVSKRARILRIVGWALAGILLVVAVAANVVAVIFGETIDSYLNSDKVDVTKRELEAQTARDTLLAEEIEGEGIVLLQNRDNALPLSAGVTKVNVFGWSSTQWVCGGSGSGGVAGETTGILEALTARGISYNEDLAEMYRSFQAERPLLSKGSLNTHDYEFCRLYEPSISDERYYPQDLLAQAREYSGTAIVVLSRIAGESIDCPRAQYRVTEKGRKAKEALGHHYLEPSPEEEDLIEYVAANYDKVVVLVNSTNPMELGAVERTPGVDACLLVGTTGTSAASAVAKVLWGDINPSGRTVDTYPYDFSTNASWAHAGAEGEGTYLDAKGLYPADGTLNANVGAREPLGAVRFVDYAEGIYVGYRWYETADAEGYWSGVANSYGVGYDGVVQYPFGFGLSYTSFDWELVGRSHRPRAAVDGSTVIELTVRVTNAGARAGKDVVELYYTAPYARGGIEKAATVLGAFEKTRLLQPGESQDVTLALPVRNMASYDCYDANGNGFSGYELEAGDYVLELKRDAHTLADCEGASTTYRVEESLSLECDPVTGAAVQNRFTGAASEAGISVDGVTTGANITYLTRSDFAGTFPRNCGANRPMSSSLKALNLYDRDLARAADAAWEKDEALLAATASADAKSSDAAAPAHDAAAHAAVHAAPEADHSSRGTTLHGRAEKVCESGSLTALGRALGSNYDDVRWDALLDRIDQKDMEKLVLHGYSSSAAIDVVGKPRTKDLDGSSQASSFNQLVSGVGFPNPTTVAQTWNRSLARAFGRAAGMECAMLGIDGWYAPATNLHRTPLGGRNYEYYSEDPLLSGQMAAETIAGSKETGTFCYLKHLVANEQDSYRDSLYTWMTEQALRELYLEPFRIAVQEGGATGIMTAYNRLGGIWAGGCTELLTGVLRGEWGFRGSVITDYSDHHVYMNADQMLRAGGSLYMDGIFADGSFECDTTTPNFRAQLRRSTKDVIYSWLNARAENLAFNEAAEASGAATLERPTKTRGTSAVTLAVALVDAVALVGILLKAHHMIKRRKERRGE